MLISFKKEIVFFLGIPKEYISQSLEAIPLISLSVFTFLIFDALLGIITGLGRLDKSNVLLLFLNILKIVISIFLLSINPNVVSMVYAVIISNTICIVLSFCIISVSFFNYKIPLQKISLRQSKQLLNYGMPILGMQITNMMMFPIIKILISNTLGVIHVSFFELAQRSAYAFRTIK